MVWMAMWGMVAWAGDDTRTGHVHLTVGPGVASNGQAAELSLDMGYWAPGRLGAGFRFVSSVSGELLGATDTLLALEPFGVVSTPIGRRAYAMLGAGPGIGTIIEEYDCSGWFGADCQTRTVAAATLHGTAGLATNTPISVGLFVRGRWHTRLQAHGTALLALGHSW